MKKIFLPTLISVFLLSSCTNEKQETNEQNNLINSSFSDEQNTDGLLKNDLKKEFDTATYEEEDLSGTGVSKDLGASLTGIEYDGSVFNETSTTALYEVSTYLPEGSGYTVTNAQIKDTVIGSDDYLRGLMTAFKSKNSTTIFDSRSFTQNSLENIYLNNGSLGAIKFSLFFDEEGNDLKTNQLKSIFQYGDGFQFQYKYNIIKNLSGSKTPITFTSNVISQNIVDGDGNHLQGFNWPCTARDWTSQKENFKFENELFSDSKYYQTPVGLCAINDSYTKTETKSCVEEGNQNQKGKIVFRVKKGSFCSPKSLIENESYYPNISCSLPVCPIIASNSGSVNPGSLITTELNTLLQSGSGVTTTGAVVSSGTTATETNPENAITILLQSLLN